MHSTISAWASGFLRAAIQALLGMSVQVDVHFLGAQLSALVKQRPEAFYESDEVGVARQRSRLGPPELNQRGDLIGRMADAARDQALAIRVVSFSRLREAPGDNPAHQQNRQLIND